MEENTIKSINWIITNRCNSKCIHCDIWKTKNESELDTHTIKNILNDEIIKKSYEKYKNKFDISLGGGEPFLRSDLQEIVDIIEKRFPGSFKTISTNGLLTERILKFIKENKHLNFKLNISIDGVGKVHDEIRGLNGTFKKTLYTFYQIRRLFPHQKIELKLTLLPQNYNQILKVYKLASKLNCNFSFKPAEDIKNYTNKIKDLNLNFTKAQLCVIRNQSFKLADIMYKKGNYLDSKFFQDIPFYLANKKKPSSCSVLQKHLTIMPSGDCFFCIKEPKAGNILNKSIRNMKNINRINTNFKCKSCMLMCGSYKDYPSNFFEKRIANIETTINCNLNCDMCTQKELRENAGKDMDTIQFKELIKKYNGITHVSFVGGEPFLNKDFFEMMNYLDKKGVTYEITTNGTLINKKVARKLKDCIGLKKINFSLDGLEEYHDKERGFGVFEKCVNALKATKDFFEVNVCTLIKQDNLEEIPKLTKYLVGLGVKNQKIIYSMNLSKDVREQSQEIVPELKIQGPRLDKQPKNYNSILCLFDSLDKIQEKYPIKISYEPKIIRKKLHSFTEGKLIYDKDVYCKQLSQLRFNNKGERIICEFIRTPFEHSITKKITNRLLPICKNCCKLELPTKSDNKLNEEIKKQKKDPKISLMIEPTNRCNLRCPTCFSHQDGRKKRDMSFGEFKKIIDENIYITENISLYNYGEPLLNKDIYSMIRYAKEKGVRYIKIATNGMELNKKNVINLLNSGLDYLSISLDGATSKTYSKFRIGGDFNLILENIKNLVSQRNKTKSNMKVEIQFIIMEHNKHEIKEIEKLAKKLGVDFLRLKRVLVKYKKWAYLLPAEPEYNRYADKKESISCKKPLKELVINCDGTVIPCCYVVGEDVNKFKLGNIFNESLKSILDSDRYKQFIKNCLSRKDNNSCCIGCNEGNLGLDYKVIDLKKDHVYYFLLKNNNYLKIKTYLKKNLDKSKNNFFLDFSNLHPSEIGFTNMVPFLHKLKSSKKWNQLVLKNFNKKYFEMKNLPLPNKLEIEPTARCNLKCPYCSLTFKKTPRRKDMLFGEFKKIIDNYKKAPEIDLWGLGEPLLNKDIFKMITYAKSKGSENCAISTNCYFISKKNIPLFFSSGLDKLILSIDGATEKTYLNHRKGSNFKKILKNVYDLCKYKKNKGLKKPKIILQFIITAYNEDEVGKITILAKKLGVDDISFKTISVTEKTKHFLPKNKFYNRYGEKEQKSVWCPALWDKAAIFSDGQVTLCCKTFSDKEKINMGNVFEKDLPSIWNGEEYKKIRQLMLLANKDLVGCNPTCPGGQKTFLK